MERASQPMHRGSRSIICVSLLLIYYSRGKISLLFFIDTYYVGVRGQITYDYLRHLGFNEGIDVTGCPSFAMFGPGIKVREKKPLTKDSEVCVTGSVSNPVNFKEFMIKNRELLPNCKIKQKNHRGDYLHGDFFYLVFFFFLCFIGF